MGTYELMLSNSLVQNINNVVECITMTNNIEIWRECTLVRDFELLRSTFQSCLQNLPTLPGVSTIGFLIHTNALCICVY